MKEIERLNSVVNNGTGKYQSGGFGAVLDLRSIPATTEIILVGDLHAKTKHLNLLLEHKPDDGASIISKLERQKAILVILGDAVHNDPIGENFNDTKKLKDVLYEMDSSIEIMQLIFDLRNKYPDSFYYLLGNHDYFSRNCEKNGVRQGLEYEMRLEERFGSEYVRRYNDFLKQCPILLVADGLVASHAGPALNINSLDDVLDLNPLEEDNVVVNTLQWGRFGISYDEDSVKRFLSAIGEENAYFIVGHSPQLIPRTEFKEEVVPKHFVIYAGKLFLGYASYKERQLDFIKVL